jgi:hypothetical protein
VWLGGTEGRHGFTLKARSRRVCNRLQTWVGSYVRIEGASSGGGTASYRALQRPS